MTAWSWMLLYWRFAGDLSAGPTRFRDVLPGITAYLEWLDSLAVIEGRG